MSIDYDVFEYSCVLFTSYEDVFLLFRGQRANKLFKTKTHLTMSIFRNTVWFLKGMREYTASGYTAASANFNQKDMDVSCEVSLVCVRI